MSDCIALVSGTTSGIGEAVARRLIDRDWRVVGLARRAASIDHQRYEHVRVDLGNTASLERLVAPRVEQLFAGQRWRRVALVNNAGDAGFLGPIPETDAERLAALLATNVVAPTWLMGRLVRLTPADTPLRIVNVSSAAAVRAVPGLGAYCASKAGLRMAGMVLAAEVELARSRGEPRDIAILSFEPGTVDTAMQESARTTSADVLPSTGMFRRFAAEGSLLPPDAPAGEIAAFVERDDEPLFSERRFGVR
jgi:benzil reductase ((S)-benzoin forming)